jgi:protein TonB
VQRFGWALGLSLAIHSIALIAASMVGIVAPASVHHLPEPLFLILGAGGTEAGVGVPGDAGVVPAAPAAAPPARSDHPERVAKRPSRDGSARPLPQAERRDRSTPTRTAAAGGSRPETTAQGHAATNSSTSNSTASVAESLPPGGRGAGGASGGGSGRASGSGPGSLAIAYEQTLAAWLNSHKYYPANLRRRGIEGEGKLRIRIARSGHVLAVDVAAAFPHPSLEAISQDWVKRAQPFPPVPDTIPGDTYVFIVPVGFRLQ